MEEIGEHPNLTYRLLKPFEEVSFGEYTVLPLLANHHIVADGENFAFNHIVKTADGKTIWEQRIGIVSTMTFIRHGQIKDTFAIADILLHHSHDLIHKAVGWLLREAGKRNKEALVGYLKPRYRSMPRTMLRYAIEKLPEPERLDFLHGNV
jgi:3-methyladenine DNA glycosylase AlkD